MYLVIVILVLAFIYDSNQTKRFCRHKWETIKEYTLPDDKGRIGYCFRNVTNYECGKCNKLKITVSHICVA